MTKVIGSSDDRDVSLLAQDQYFREVHSRPWLTAEETARLLTLIAQGNEERRQSQPDAMVLEQAKEARNQLVEGYQLFVVSVVRHFVGKVCGVDLMDLVQEGNIGFMQALEYYRPESGRFGSYVAASIRSTIVHAVRDRWHAVHVPAYVHERMVRMWRSERELLAVLGRQPSVSELAAALSLSERDVLEAMEAEDCQRVQSVQALAESWERDEDKYGFVGLYQDEQPQEESELMAVLRQAFEVLTVSQQAVLDLRYGIGERPGQVRSYQQVAELLGTVFSCAQKTDWRGCRRLREVLELAVINGRYECRVSLPVKARGKRKEVA